MEVSVYLTDITEPRKPLHRILHGMSAATTTTTASNQEEEINLRVTESNAAEIVSILRRAKLDTLRVPYMYPDYYCHHRLPRHVYDEATECQRSSPWNHEAGGGSRTANKGNAGKGGEAATAAASDGGIGAQTQTQTPRKEGKEEEDGKEKEEKELTVGYEYGQGDVLVRSLPITANSSTEKETQFVHLTEAITETHCFVWLEQVFSHIASWAAAVLQADPALHLPPETSTAEAHAAAALYKETFTNYIYSERRQLQTACILFVKKRLLTTHRLAILRQSLVPVAESPASLLEVNGKQSPIRNEEKKLTEEEEREEVEDSGMEVLHSYYEFNSVVGASHLPRSSGADDAPSSSSSAYTSTASSPSPNVWFRRQPFELKYEPDLVGDPLWGVHTLEMQRRIRAWQFPEEVPPPPPPVRQQGSDPRNTSDWTQQRRACSSSKFLVFEPPSRRHGIGSMLEVIAVAFRYAICLDRILLLNFVDLSPTILKWQHSGCRNGVGSSVWECYFEDISGCYDSVSPEEVQAAHSSEDGFEFNYFPLSQQRVLVLKGLPSQGECTVCHSSWSRHTRFFDGLFVGHTGYIPKTRDYWHFSAVMGASKLPWASQFLRYLLRPRPWFAEALDQIVELSMVSSIDRRIGDGNTTAHSSTATTSSSSSSSSTNQSGTLLPRHAFPRSFLSLHIRYGMKSIEQKLYPLSRFMSYIERKLPHIQDIFVSTETQGVLDELVVGYPSYRFHYLQYPRLEFLDLGLDFVDRGVVMDWVDEFMFSMANLYVASEADAFVGTLSSNWCMMILHLERTRGDGGFDYHSLDVGSPHTTCY